MNGIDYVVADLQRQVDRLRRLLESLHKWDVMDATADGAYWRAQIVAALNREDE